MPTIKSTIKNFDEKYEDPVCRLLDINQNFYEYIFESKNVHKELFTEYVDLLNSDFKNLELDFFLRNLLMFFFEESKSNHEINVWKYIQDTVIKLMKDVNSKCANNAELLKSEVFDFIAKFCHFMLECVEHPIDNKLLGSVAINCLKENNELSFCITWQFYEVNDFYQKLYSYLSKQDDDYNLCSKIMTTLTEIGYIDSESKEYNKDHEYAYHKTIGEMALVSVFIHCQDIKEMLPLFKKITGNNDEGQLAVMVLKSVCQYGFRNQGGVGIEQKCLDFMHLVGSDKIKQALDEGANLVKFAAVNGYNAILDYLTSLHGDITQHHDKYSILLLIHEACFNNQIASVKYLIQQLGQNVNTITNEDKLTLLHVKLDY